MIYDNNWAVIIPMANEEQDFHPLIKEVKGILKKIGGGKVYFIVDNASKDKTLELCRSVSNEDDRFVTVYAPENKNVVDAYIRGYVEAYNAGYELIIEMDAGLSHDPKALPMFLRVLNEGNECAFGSRFINGGSMSESVFRRKLLSKTGTILSNMLLGTKMFDMTSGYQGLHRDVVEKIIKYPFKSKAHFYQTEIRYLLRNRKMIEIPIHYKAPSPRVSQKAIKNAISTLMYYFIKRITFKRVSL